MQSVIVIRGRDSRNRRYRRYRIRLLAQRHGGKELDGTIGKFILAAVAVLPPHNLVSVTSVKSWLRRG
jgi:hypothetical protein